MMLDDIVVNYMIKGIKETFSLQGAEMKEKTVAEGKVKLKFQRGSLKLQAEFGNNEISEIVYSNFINKHWHEKVSLNEFKASFNEFLEEGQYADVHDIEEIAEQICRNIKQEKLF